MAEFTGIFLPAEILALEDLNLTEKVVLCQIIPLALERPCTAENKTIAKRLGISDTAVSLNIKSLDAKGYIDVDTKKNEGFKREVNLYFENDTLFKIFNKPSLKNLKSPIEESYIAYLKNLKSLFKNLKEPTQNFKRASLKILNSPINRYESKDESIVESKEENTTTTSASDFFENEILEENFSEKELAAMEEANDVPAFVAIAQQQAAEIAKNQITQESLRSQLLENEACKVAAKNGRVKAEDYAEAVQKFISDKFGLGENARWTGITDALKHFCFWVPSFNRIKNQEQHGRTRTVLHTGKTTGRHIVEQSSDDDSRVEPDENGVLRRISTTGVQTFAG